MTDELIIAFALVLVIEGSLYALFPAGMKRMALRLEQMSVSALRNAGLLAAVLGVGVVWLVRRQG